MKCLYESEEAMSVWHSLMTKHLYNPTVLLQKQPSAQRQSTQTHYRPLYFIDTGSATNATISKILTMATC